MKFLNLLKRFNEVATIHVGECKRFKKFVYFLDYLRAYILHGASFNDYFGYQFYRLNNRGRKQYITLKRTRKLQKLVNNPAALNNFRNKVIFNTIFSSYLGRKWLDVSKSSFSEFSNFIDSLNSDVFIKDVNGLCGIGVERLSVRKIEKKSLYHKLTTSPTAQFIIEEPILQKGILSDLHPWSVNTIRITTLMDSKGNIHIMGATLRVGRRKDHRDNLHSGGIAAHIDIKTGIIFLPAFDKFNKLYIIHPDTNKQLIGLKIPYWEECKNFIIDIAKKSPEVRYVGWDVVISEEGKFLLIEGNDNGDHDVQQLHYQGLWPLYKEILTIQNEKR